jgi:asparagine synthase (glutamine-hydrolysing)
MCGIIGWINPALTDPEAARRLAQPALKALAGRGPDGDWMECRAGWILGFTRLAILDLSERANQPMTDGRGGWLVYNGEIYNFKELRAELAAYGYEFRSTGDTEVLLYALRHWGAECLERLRGMFAFAWLDTERKELMLPRDRFGVKPLAYDLRNSEIRFASDLFALRSLPGAGRDVDPEAAYLYMGLGYVPAPYSILKGVHKVRPGHYLKVKFGESLTAREHQYWSISPGANGHRDSQSANHHLEEYERRAVEAVRYRLISDVPVGSLLSGGIDSTLVTALCREQDDANIPSFTMGFDDPCMDEAPFARAIADRLGGAHHEFRIAERDVLDVWSGLWKVYDEPFADSSALPMVALSRLVKESVKVALCGDGGDEVFCGYPWHRAMDRLSASLAVPPRLRKYAAASVSGVAPSLRYKATVFGQSDRTAQWTTLRTGLDATTKRWLPVAEAENQPAFDDYFREWAEPLAGVSNPLEWACRMDLLTYLPDDLMVKSDRASMSVGLEMREPFLDHQLISWCLELPIAERYDSANRVSKLLPRAALRKRLPAPLIDRPKQGFTPPLGRWLDGPLRPFVQDALERLQKGSIAPLGLPAGIKSWRDCAAKLNDEHQQFLWRTVCFAEWLREHQATVTEPRAVASGIKCAFS